LQHGSLPLIGDLARICDALNYPSEQDREIAKTQVRQRATTLSEAVGWSPTWDQAAEAVVFGFVEAFDVDFITDDLSPTERARASQLVKETYSNDQWTLRR
jgi:lipoate-protein ligase A